MSTERKPGSRGETARFTGAAKKSDPAFDRDTAVDPEGPKKGSTKIPSRKPGFKKRPRK
ncbi:MAG: hypothetical protein AB8G96_04970 [Phycisphaerales bacterium]